MGNAIGCSASGERLVSAARDGDAVEAQMLLRLNPCLARYSTFGGLNSPLHFAAARGHEEIVALLLESGADINSRNYCGQTALMQACRYGHWEVVQTLMVYKSNVARVDYLNGRTALHFAAAEGHVKCLRLVVADFTSAPFRSFSSSRKDDICGEESAPLGQIALSKFINKAADGGVTALHMAALGGHFECVNLLLDLNANVSAVTFNYGSSTNLIGAGSTPLHYAACAGNIKCCQVLLARGASKMALNCNGWLPVDIAKIWGRHSLESLLSPYSDVVVPPFPRSNYLSLPLMSILNIARDCGLKPSTIPQNENDICAVCLERECTVSAEGCKHELCVKCALSVCSSLTSITTTSETASIPGMIPCPLCRNGIVSFTKLSNAPAKVLKLGPSINLCSPCILPSRDSTPQTESCRSDTCNHATSTSEIACPVSCTPFSSVHVPPCSCKSGLCPSHGDDTEMQEQSPNHAESMPYEPDMHGQRLEKTTCSKMFWNRRSCHREQQCNSEISA